MKKRHKDILIVTAVVLVLVLVAYPIYKHYKEYKGQRPAAAHRIAPRPEYVKEYSRPATEFNYTRNPGKYNKSK